MAAGRECFDLAGIIFVTLQKPAGPPSDPLGEAWRYHSFGTVRWRTRSGARTARPSLRCARRSSKRGSRSGREADDGAPQLADKGSFKWRTTMGNVAPTRQRLDAASDEQPGDARPVKQARSA